MLDLIGKFINGTPWAIAPEMLSEIRRIWFDHLDGKKPDIAAIEAAIGRPLKNDQPPSYETINGVAVITASGIISKRMNLFMDISGGVSIEKLTAQFKEALADPGARAILLVIDSPGGAIDGVFELADLIYASRDVKPIVSLAYGTMASAAYLIGAAASAVYATDIATEVGSIGVVAVHADRSAKDAASGIVKTEIYRGKYKRIITDGPLTDEGRLSLMEKVDYYYSLFIDEIARFRGVSSEAVLTKMSTDVTDYFIGQQAVAAGLIDGIMPMDSVIKLALSETETRLIHSGVVSGKEKRMQETIITTIEQLAAAYPDLVSAVREQGIKSVDLEAPRTKAAEAERTRILGLCEAHFGKEAGDRFAAVVKTGVTIEQYAAIAAINPPHSQPAASAEDKKKEEILAALKASGAANPGADGRLPSGDDAKGYGILVDEHMAANKCSKLVAMQAITAKYPEKHREWIMEVNKTRRSAHV